MSIADARGYLAEQRQTGDTTKQRKAELHIQQQFALPVVTLLFGMIGSTLGTSMKRVSNSTGVGICILIVLGYYFFGFLMTSLGNLGILSPVVAAWLPNVVIALTAAGLLARVDR
jgi:lipopolysaccharide export system permease protein